MAIMRERLRLVIIVPPSSHTHGGLGQGLSLGAEGGRKGTADGMRFLASFPQDPSLSRPSLPQIPRLKCGWLRLRFRFTGGRHCPLDGEGHSLPAPRAKPAGAPPHPRGFLPRIKSGVGGNPNPLAGEDRHSRKLPSICLSVPLPCPIAGFGLSLPSPRLPASFLMWRSSIVRQSPPPLRLAYPPPSSSSRWRLPPLRSGKVNPASAS